MPLISSASALIVSAFALEKEVPPQRIGRRLTGSHVKAVLRVTITAHAWDAFNQCVPARGRLPVLRKVDIGKSRNRRRVTLHHQPTSDVSMPTKPTVNPPEREGRSYIRSRTKQMANAEENIQRVTAIETLRLM
jgi:hypothetical protein